MPSTSRKQHNFMEAVAHNKAFAKKVGVPQSVGQDFSKADKGRKFSKGGSMPVAPRITTGLPPVQMKSAPAKKAPAPAVRTTTTAPQGMAKSFGPKYYSKGGGVAPSKMGAVKTASPSRDGITTKAKTKGKVIKMAGSSKGMMRGGKC